MGTDIFVSYAREDEERVRQLVSALEQRGWSVFWDHRIPAGQSWRSYIGKALDEARCVITAWSPASIKSEYVLEEAERSRRRGVLVPLRLDAVEPPFGFGELNAADLSSWHPGTESPEFEQLVQDLEQVLASSHAPTDTTTQGTVSVAVAAIERPGRTHGATRAAFYSAVVVAIVVLAAGAVYIGRRLSSPPSVHEARARRELAEKTSGVASAPPTHSAPDPSAAALAARQPSAPTVPSPTRAQQDKAPSSVPAAAQAAADTSAAGGHEGVATTPTDLASGIGKVKGAPAETLPDVGVPSAAQPKSVREALVPILIDSSSEEPSPPSPTPFAPRAPHGVSRKAVPRDVTRPARVPAKHPREPPAVRNPLDMKLE